MTTSAASEEFAVSPAEVRTWIDKAQITEVITLTCRANDRVDIPLLRSLFHPDATDDHGGMYDGPIEDAYSFLTERAVGSTTTTEHVVHNIYIELDGDNARSETYATACHHRDISGQRCDEFLGIRYLDRLERREDRVWRISARKVIWDWWRTLPTTELTLWSDPNDPRFARGSRGPSDPSYSWFTDPE
ncbi:MAG: hypothetical protein JW395_3393 [Nitrospira sp.]|nr:hypothetical protein [Nitrospira sp.]